ncbi:MAG: hypothetical protein V4507_06435 [Verrucomicrobiota bacterium]
MKKSIFPPDYEERVYAGVLGKRIGVYLGRPFETISNRIAFRMTHHMSGSLKESSSVPE